MESGTDGELSKQTSSSPLKTRPGGQRERGGYKQVEELPVYEQSRMAVHAGSFTDKIRNPRSCPAQGVSVGGGKESKLKSSPPESVWIIQKTEKDRKIRKIGKTGKDRKRQKKTGKERLSHIVRTF